MKQVNNRRPPRSSITLLCEKLGIPEQADEPVIIFIHNDVTFKIIQSELKIPSKIEKQNNEYVILLNDTSRSSKELAFDVYRLSAHSDEILKRLSTLEAEDWCCKNDIMTSEHLLREMSCDQYALEQIKYTVPASRSLLKDVSMETCRMIYPDFAMNFVGHMCRTMNEEMGYRREFMNHLIAIYNNIREKEKPKQLSVKRLNELEKSMNELESEFGKEPERVNIDLPPLFDVCKKLGLNPNKMDSFDKSMKKILNVDWDKTSYSFNVKTFIHDWVAPEYKKYRSMVSELQRTPQRKTISRVLFAIIVTGEYPSLSMVEDIRNNLNGEFNYHKNTAGLMSYNERMKAEVGGA